MKQTTAKLEFINDRNGSIYAWTPKDGPYRLMVSLQQSKSLKNGQRVKVKYSKYGQYAILADE